MSTKIIGMGATPQKMSSKEIEKALAENKTLKSECKKLAADLKKANEIIESLKTEGGSDNGTNSKNSSGSAGKSKDKK